MIEGLGHRGTHHVTRGGCIHRRGAPHLGKCATARESEDLEFIHGGDDVLAALRAGLSWRERIDRADHLLGIARSLARGERCEDGDHLVAQERLTAPLDLVGEGIGLTADEHGCTRTRPPGPRESQPLLGEGRIVPIVVGGGGPPALLRFAIAPDEMRGVRRLDPERRGRLVDLQQARSR